MKHFFSMINEGTNANFKGHHDVYLRPEQRDSHGYLDRFAKFRSKRHSLRYKLEVIGHIIFIVDFILIFAFDGQWMGYTLNTLHDSYLSYRLSSFAGKMR